MTEDYDDDDDDIFSQEAQLLQKNRASCSTGVPECLGSINQSIFICSNLQ